MAKDKRRKKTSLNRGIVHGIITGQWDIEINSAHQYIEEYLAAIELLENGADFSELGYSERRLALAPALIFPGQTLSTTRGREITNLTNTDIPKGTIVHLKLTGAMRSQDGFSSRGISSLAQQIANAQNNPNIGGAILEAQTGGGETIAGTMLQNAIQGFTKPFWVYTHLLASAGIKGTLGADMIVASGNETIVGSIGTMLTLNKRLIEFYNKYEEDIYAEGSTGKNKEFRAYLNGNRGPFIERLNQVNEEFINQVKKHRHIRGTQEQVDKIFSGETVLAKEAVQVGLIDGVGTFEDVVQGVQSDIMRGANFTKRIQGLEHSEPTILNNSKNLEMKFTLNSFWAKLYPMLNKKFNFEFKAEDDFESVLSTIEGAKGLEEMKEEIKAEIINEIKAEIKPGASANQETETETEEEPEEKSTKQMLQELTQMVKAQQKQIDTLAGEKKGLEGQVAKLKSNKIDENEDGEHNATNGGEPGTQTFKTIKSFNTATKLENAKSKY